MSKRDQKSTEDKPWDTKFTDDRDDKGNLSRSATHRKDKSNALFVTILTIALLVLAALPVGAWTIWQNQMNRPVATESVASSSRSKQSVAAKQKTTKKQSSKASTDQSSSTSVQSSSAVAASSSSAASESSSDASSASSSSSAAASYVTVGSGQGIYRIAANNGLSVSELLQLNGLSNGSTIKPGQQLRVK
ncbi:SAG1386/EF1546 family surface-associated protein [Loigolactobacillus zhaoyuanensis]|uniref:SAG1386/EF1546 family surface-associated protein n=1 Tax=Loigolactobacillus zhaoyuanensis TaxID=2486017 RepID=A0ABW8UGY6_9LACO